MKKSMALKFRNIMLAGLVAAVIGLQYVDSQAQTQSIEGHSGSAALTDKSRPSSDVAQSSADDPYFKEIYKSFYDTYRLGPEDEIAVRVVGQPDYTLEKAKVSPVGRIYHPLIGDVDVAGLTIAQATARMTAAFSDYIIDPRLSVSLLEAKSALVGVLGDISRPGVVVMSRPMTLLDIITETGGVSELGSQSNITLLRRLNDGRMTTMKVNVKRIIEGKAGPEENVTMRAGDTLIVHGNLRKKIGSVTSLLGFGRFVEFLVRR